MSDNHHPEDASSDTTAIASGAWIVVERITAQFSQMAIFILAARILGPAEFGFFALISACAILLLRFAEVGWAQYIMSWHGDSHLPRQVLLMAIISGIIVASAGAATGSLLPVFGFSALAGQLVTLFSIWVFVATTSSAQKGIMIWQSKLRSSAFCEISGELVGLAVAVSALLSGYGVLSLVFGRLAFQSVHLVLSFTITRLTPLRGMKRDQFRHLVSFSAHLFTSRMIGNLRLYAATFIIGGFLGPAAVGFYRAAERLVGALAEVVAVPAEILAWNLFRKAKNSQTGGLERFQAQANIYFRALIALTAPVFIWLPVMGEELITGILGEEWLPALPIIAILALSRALIMPSVATEAILSLAGEIRRLTPFTLIFLLLGVVMTLIGAQFGLHAVAWSQAGVSFIILIATSWMHQRFGAINAKIVLGGCVRLLVPVALGSGTLIFLKEMAQMEDLSVIAIVASATIGSVIVYAVAMAVVEPDLRRWLLSHLRPNRQRRHG